MVLAILSLPSPGVAQVTIHGTIAAGGGGALLDGDEPAFQQRFRQRKDGYAGIEDFTVTRMSDTSLFRFEGRFIQGNDDHRLAARWEKFDAYYVQADYRSFRTFYDGSGGRLLPRDLSISWFNEALALDRSYFTVEIGTLVPNRPQWRLRYERNTRDGTKNSLRWGETNLGGQPFVPRALIPSYLLVDEQRDIVTAEVSEQSENANWKVAGRYERTKVNNRHVARRRAFENQDRYVTTHEATDTDVFSGHAFYDRIFNERLRGSAGGLITKIDTNLSGSKIYGGTPDAEYSPTFVRRQPQDVGYYGLTGGTRMKQYVGNLNVTYQPVKNWLIRPGLKYEHLRQDSGEDHFDTDFGGGAAPRAIIDQIESASRNSWNELTEEIEARYLRWTSLTLDARAQFNQGTGNLVEQSILVPNSVRGLDRETEYERVGQRYIVNATWYARPGLTFAAQYNYRLKLADYDHRRDSTSNATRSFDRYPAFIIDQDIESQDGNVRMTWRPKSMLSFVTRYAWQRAIVTSTMSGLPEIENGRLTRHVITQTATWNPTARLYLTGAVSVTHDKLVIPPHRLTMNSDNNYVSASLGAGYVLGKITDLYLDANHYRADNYVDNPTVTLPMNAGQTTQSAFLTWVRRQSDRLIYTARYGYAMNRDGTFGGLNDFDAHIFYAKVQYKF
ncbi:MAG: hypothetical protein Q7S40_06655 [Opitutaceae bacterium]|nr:hypothetical protein [Opitutaceae bacterium]